MKDAEFLERLTAEAEFQSQLEQRRWLPKQFDAVFAFVGMYSWQTLLILSLLVTIVIEVGR